KDYIIGNVKEEEPVAPHTYKPDLWKNTKCLDCVYLPLCFGGCRYMEFVRTGRIDNVDCRYDYFEATLGAFIDQEVRYDGGQ
ncbi:MAG: SPASM domain-containing protein, partial [Thermodesulfovibrionales bacterium]